MIRALNEDIPYDRFVTLQLAADQLPGTVPADQAAIGFLTVGRWFTGVVPDVIDDQIDVITRGLMGLTVQCARCHDHAALAILSGRLKSLELECDPKILISDSSVDVVTNLKDLERFQFLNPNSVTDSQLLQLAKLPHIRVIELATYGADKKRFTDAGIAKFRDLRPDVTLVIDGKDHPATKK